MKKSIQMSDKEITALAARTRRDRLAWWRKAGYGMFIHWNLFSLTGQGGWEWWRGWLTREEWDASAKRFRPKRFNPDAWAQLAKDAGMKYAVLTTMSHDGFCIFDSPVSDFTSVKTAANRDFVAEYVKAFRKAGLKVGLYYSLSDWRWPACRRGPGKNPGAWAEFIDYTHENVRTLCSNYGKIDILWYDGGGVYTSKDWQSVKLNAMVRRLQPHILINNRAGTDEDFGTPEGSVGKYLGGRAWETCTTLNASWPYTRGDLLYHTPVQTLYILAQCAANGGNLLLNVGPTPDGLIPAIEARQLREIGSWLDRYGEAVYGTEHTEISKCPFTLMTKKKNKVYAFIKSWSFNGTYHIMDFPHKRGFKGLNGFMERPDERTRRGAPDFIKRAYLLPDRGSVDVSWKGDGILLSGLPKRPPHPYLNVVVFELSKNFSVGSKLKESV